VIAAQGRLFRKLILRTWRWHSFVRRWRPARLLHSISSIARAYLFATGKW
jgi:hypothetical protein